MPGMLFLGIDGMVGRVGGLLAMLIPECLRLIMETSNWPASHYW